MKPKRIILIRHGQSEGNVDPNVHATTPDHKLSLTPEGIKQAEEAGAKLKDLLGRESVHVYSSPYARTRQTIAEVKKSLNVVASFEEPRLREQEWGHLRAFNATKKIEEERDSFGAFYFRFPDGESGADVYDRVSTFLETLHRDFQKDEYPDNTLIVTHGLTIRLFLMRWFHSSVEEFETWRNPKNCQFFVMDRFEEFIGFGMEKKFKYKIPEMEKYPNAG